MNTAKASVRKLRKVKPSERKNIAVAPSFFARRIYCGRRAPLEHFLSLAIRSRSLREELGYVAVDLAWDACLRSVCLRPVDAVETEPHGAWRELGARLRCAQSAPPASRCDGSPCSPVSRRLRIPACAAGDARVCPEGFVLSAAPCRALHAASRAPMCFLCRACRAGAGAM